MRNVKVIVQADTAQALGKVRELTGALTQLDAIARQSAENALKALGGSGTGAAAAANGANISAAVGAQQPLVAGAQVQAGQVDGVQAQTKKKVKTEQEKIADANKKLSDKIQREAEKQFQKFADDIGNIFAEAFEGLLQGGLKGGLKGLKEALKSMFQSIMRQLIGNIADQIKTAISKKIMESFTKAVDPKKGVVSDAAKTDPATGQTVALPGGTSPSNATGAVGSQMAAGIAAGLNPLTPSPTTTTTSGTQSGTSNTTTSTTTQAAAQAASLGGVGKFQMQIASMLPGLGMSLGGMLGMGNTGASMLGSIGGLMLGGAGAVGLLGGAGAGIFASGGALASMHGLAAFMTNPFTIAAAGAILIGAIIWGINSRRRKEEKIRNQAMLDAFSSLDDLLKQVNGDQLDGASAINQANNIRKQYVEQMSQLKDGKTRRIALADVSRIDARIAQIKQAAEAQTARKAMDAKLVPTFADGGKVGTAVSGGHGYKVLGGDGAFMRPFRGRVPGIYDRKDDFLARLSGNEVVLTPDVWKPIAPYLKQKRVPGFAGGGMVDSSAGSNISGGTQTSSNQEIVIEELTIHLNNQFGSETAARIVDIGLKTPGGQQAVVKSVRTHIGESGLADGLVRDINNVNDRGF